MAESTLYSSLAMPQTAVDAYTVERLHQSSWYVEPLTSSLQCDITTTIEAPGLTESQQVALIERGTEMPASDVLTERYQCTAAVVARTVSSRSPQPEGPSFLFLFTNN